MTTARREIGLGFVDDTVTEGVHIIYVYNDDTERKRTIAQFLRQGLADGDKLLYLAAEVSPEEMREELHRLGVNGAEPSPALEVTEGHHTLCPDCTFSGDHMLGEVGEFYRRARQEGFAGARGAGEMSWALEEGRASVPDLLAYEAKLNDVLARHPLTTVCQYDARRFDGEVIWDMLNVHPLMIVRGQLVRNPCYLPPGEFLGEYRRRRAESPVHH